MKHGSFPEDNRQEDVPDEGEHKRAASRPGIEGVRYNRIDGQRVDSTIGQKVAPLMAAFLTRAVS
jgi:hypothetical protein